MKWTEQIEQEAHHIVETVTDAQWALIRELASLMAKPMKPAKTPEQVAKERELEEAARLAKQKNSWISIREWRKKKAGDIEIPSRYDLMVDELTELIDLATPFSFVDKNLIWSGMSAMYAYGFKRGTRYQQNQYKKKVAP